MRKNHDTMSLILNLESSTEICSVALSDKGKVIDYTESQDGQNHARLMGVYIENIIKKNNLDFRKLSAVAVSKGPGSYTGLRIGVSMAKGLCYAHGIPLIAVSPLQAMSSFVNDSRDNWNLPAEEDLLFCPMIDARRMEVYTAFYNGKNEEIEEVSAKIIDKDSFKDILDRQPVVFLGNGSSKAEKVIEHENAFFVPGITTSAQFMCFLSYNALVNKQFVNLAYFEPFYLKDFIAGVPRKIF